VLITVLKCNITLFVRLHEFFRAGEKCVFCECLYGFVSFCRKNYSFHVIFNLCVLIVIMIFVHFYVHMKFTVFT
jgi:hypothetical protein